MPIYEYVCPSCDHEFEELTLSMSGKKTPECPSCGAGGTNRKLSVFAARQGAAEAPMMPVGGCGRCGDPNGPCSM